MAYWPSAESHSAQARISVRPRGNKGMANRSSSSLTAAETQILRRPGSRRSGSVGNGEGISPKRSAQCIVKVLLDGEIDLGLCPMRAESHPVEFGQDVQTSQRCGDYAACGMSQAPYVTEWLPWHSG